jgi:hypothetical protein
MSLFSSIQRRVVSYTGVNISEDRPATMKTETVDSSEALVNIYPTTRHHGICMKQGTLDSTLFPSGFSSFVGTVYSTTNIPSVQLRIPEHSDRLQDVWPGFDSWQEQVIILNSAAARLLLRPTHSPMQRLLRGSISLRLKRPAREADNLQPMPRSRKCGSIRPLPHSSS